MRITYVVQLRYCSAPSTTLNLAMKEEAPLRAGTITRIARQRKDSQRVSVFVDGEFAFGVHQDVLLERAWRKGVVLTPEDVRRAQEADAVLRARSRALSLLSYRSRSTSELAQRLRRDGYEDAVVEAAVRRMQELNYLDDAAFAREYAVARLNARGYGPHRIARELQARGIDRSLIETALAEAFQDDHHELEAARSFARKRLPRLERESDPFRRRKKLYDALRRRGYGSDVIRQVVEEILDAT